MTKPTKPTNIDWEKKFDQLLTDCFSGDLQQVKYHTWKYKEEALKTFISNLLEQTRRETLEEVEAYATDHYYDTFEPDRNLILDHINSMLSQLKSKKDVKGGEKP